jgi:phage-related protein
MPKNFRPLLRNYVNHATMNQPPNKKLIWIRSTHANLCSFPDSARHQAGYQLRRVQQGKMPEDWKPMSEVGPGAIEIRIHHPHEHRAIYVAKFSEAIYVIHAFEKKTQKTSQTDITIARINYAQIKNLRKQASQSF